MTAPPSTDSASPSHSAGPHASRALAALGAAESLPALGAALRRHAIQHWATREANLVRARRRESGTWLWETEPPRQLDDDEVDLIERALRTRAPARARLPGGPAMAQPLVDTASGWIDLLLRGPPPVPGIAWRRPGWHQTLHLLRSRVQDLLQSSARAGHSLRIDAVERLQRALYGIADLASSQLDLHRVLADIHSLLGELMFVESLCILRREDEISSFRYLYFSDSRAKVQPPIDTPLLLHEHAQDPAVALLLQGRSVQGSAAQVAGELGLVSNGQIDAQPHCWLGVPMLSSEGEAGALIVQNYQADVLYGEEERELLVFVARLIQAALERRSMQQRLERKVEERTQALRAEVAERERAVRLQRALYRIAELSSSPIGLDAFYAAVHGVVGELLNAKNFLIALLQPDGSGLHFPYQVDETGDVYGARALRRGLSEYVLRLGHPVLIGAADVDKLVQAGEVERIGTPAVCWLGVPLRTSERTVGLIIVQSYTEGIAYSLDDQELLSFVSVHIASGLERKQAQDSLRSSHAELTATLQRLRDTQRELVSAEKMAALGQLVAGVAHEVNTPLGIAVTATSGLAQQSRQLRRAVEDGALQRSGLDRFLAYADEALDMIARNLKRSAELISTFKQVAVDRSSDGRRRYDLGMFMQELLPSLRLLWKRMPVELEFICPDAVEMEGFPGALGQIITNLVQNALLHAFPEGRSGRMRLVATLEGTERVRIEFSDDGVGIAPGNLAQIFDPFFTTRRGQGGTGLGLHIVFNLVNEKLGGAVHAESTPGHGTRFVLELPRVAPGA